MNTTIIQRLGGRKFLATIGCGLATSLLQAFGKIDPAGTTYAMVTVATVGVFIGGNVLQKKQGGGGVDGAGEPS
jgi:hypothetical protein